MLITIGRASILGTTAACLLFLGGCASNSDSSGSKAAPESKAPEAKTPETKAPEGGPSLALSCYTPDIPDHGGVVVRFVGAEGSAVEALVKGVGSESSGEDVVRSASGTPGAEWPLGSYEAGDWTLEVTAKVEPPSEHKQYEAKWTRGSSSAMDMVCYRFTRD